MATKKKTAAAAADTQTESAAAAAPMTENTTPTAPAMREPAAAEGSGVARVRVRFVKRCEVSALRVTCAPGATMTLTAELAAKLEAAGFARIVGI